MDTAVSVTMLEHPTEAHHPLGSVRVARHSSTAYNFSPPPREAMASSPTLLSPQYTHPSPPHTRRILPPPPSAASPSMTSDRLRLRVRHGPSPTQAKFGKFDAADAPTETVPSASAISEVKELLIPQLEFLNQKRVQAEVWALSRILLDTLTEETGQLIDTHYPTVCSLA
ncbi:hypothetical protein ZWY2020_046687 [Hordeum vulgare]|nr:hypothetical protein ZWY2020_046687 [Hordeum vulgare]